MRKIIVCVLTCLVVACGSSKKVTENSSAKNVNTRQEVMVEPSKEALKEVKKAVTETKKDANSYLNETTLAYVEHYAPLAMDEMRKFKIPASITLAQGILESGSGKSQLSAKSNNHFGIKCHTGWKGAKVYHDDDAKGECFRKYQFPATSYQDHSLFLTTRFRYASLFRLKKDDYKAWAKGLKKAGYATDPKYPDKLISFIEKYELYKYDRMVLKGKIDTDHLTEKVEVAEIVKDFKEESKRRKKLNRKGVHTVKEDDTLYSISQKYGISIEEIKVLNNLDSNVIHQGDELKLRSDAKRDSYHIVEKKETLYSISKEYGVTVEELKQMNGLKDNTLSIGQELRVD
ncbi:flagellum-specific peptidoglycan hydrolase FlgJ/LysM repeat protein [Wenyingzhuangia heitensis]|uniref:Peptidoglycan hydrolase n=1 Tax=Wenyingzhuangia heitensis TaxID=1487859 RepID=A0ABX0U5P0_9FLAO|nr:glucosaminidase domain-containing protein [Wenyingzhuangia heitensis]NIJ44160.1 flagellum-specific peptidoglycan hydrolase FlgJ/LysM repeat protein [Wenyingzhuangia heitensis]